MSAGRQFKLLKSAALMSCEEKLIYPVNVVLRDVPSVRMLDTEDI